MAREDQQSDGAVKQLKELKQHRAIKREETFLIFWPSLIFDVNAQWLNTGGMLEFIQRYSISDSLWRQHVSRPCCSSNTFGLNITAAPSATNNNHHVTNGSSDGSEELPQATQFLINSFKRLNAEVSAASGNGVDMKALLPISLAVYALLKIGSERTTPLWVTLGLFSFSSFVSLHPGALDGSAAGNHSRKRRPKGTTRRPNKSS